MAVTFMAVMAFVVLVAAARTVHMRLGLHRDADRLAALRGLGAMVMPAARAMHMAVAM